MPTLPHVAAVGTADADDAGDEIAAVAGGPPDRALVADPQPATNTSSPTNPAAHANRCFTDGSTPPHAEPFQQNMVDQHRHRGAFAHHPLFGTTERVIAANEDVGRVWLT